MDLADTSIAKSAFTRIVMTRRRGNAWHALVLLVAVASLSAPLWSPALAVGVIVASIALLLGILKLASHQILSRDVAVARLLTERELQAEEVDRERHEMSRQFADQISRDPLTGLFNRAAFATHVDAALVRAREQGAATTVLALDIARFGAFNERYGAIAADELLVAVAARIAGALRPHDTLARVNGDVFAALLETVPPELVRDVAHRVLMSVRANYSVGSGLHTLDVACGLVTVMPGENLDSLEVVRRAEVALQNAKATRTPVVIFEPRIERETRERLKFHDDLARAGRDGELFLLYQPLFDARTGRVGSVEALMRWNHPERGLVPPSEFIPVAENSGQIVEMGLWALTSACRQQREWRTRYQQDVEVAVNFSARQLAEFDVVERVREVVAREAFDPRKVKLEITESLLVEDMQRAVDVLVRLRSLGVRLSVDDFGTGYSSLSRLGELPIDELKIDRYFVEGIGREGPRETILTAAIAMGHGLGLTVVAEGVETAEQLDYLRAHDIDYIQGFLVGRPVDVETVMDIVKAPAPEQFSLPVQRGPVDESPRQSVPAVMPSLERVTGRRLFAR